MLIIYIEKVQKKIEDMKTNFKNDFDVTSYTRIDLHCDAINCAIKYNIEDEYATKFVELYCNAPEKWYPKNEMTADEFKAYTTRQQEQFVKMFKKHEKSLLYI